MDAAPYTTRILTPAQRIAWLRLIRTNNIGPATFRLLINRFGSAEAALEALPALSRRGGSAAPLAPFSQVQAEDEIARTQKLGGKLIAQGEPDYPYLLNFTVGAPPLLTLVGGKDLNLSKTVAMVGARNASAAGCNLTAKLARDLGRAGYVVVSGLARGIDTAAHRATIETGTLAVMAGGLDHIYPAQNEKLAHQIVDQGGALLTEMPPDWQARARDFPRRNRLVSGVALGVVVVEAAKRSGSLITARLALEQNREVFAVPGSPLDPRAEGGNALIQQGAWLAASAKDIITQLTTADPSRTALFEPESDLGLLVEDAPPAEFAIPPEAHREKLISAMSPTPTAIDDLIASTHISAATMQELLLELDLAGRLEHFDGQLVALRA